MTNSKIKQGIRNAVTLVEVIFAIGVILIGLLGLLSILPLAGQRARDSVGLSTGPQVANRVLAELKAHRLLSKGLLTTLNGNAVPSTTNASFCFDPIFISNPLVQQASLGTTSYFPGWFPFYDSNYFPIDNQRVAVDPFQASNDATRNFRLFRVGINASPFIARMLTENRDDLITTQPDDRSLPSRLSDGEIAPFGPNGLEYGRRIPSGEFSWLVTVNPHADGIYASVAVVVLRNRTLELEFPPPGDASTRKNYISERLASVSVVHGFSGGAGGVVQLECSDKVDATITPGDWLMLSSVVSIGPPSISKHRWYRVVGIEGEPVYLPDYEKWTQRVLLDGPDLDPTVQTLATLLSDVVCVTETVLKLSEI